MGCLEQLVVGFLSMIRVLYDTVIHDPTYASTIKIYVRCYVNTYIVNEKDINIFDQK